jgi:hypothetical protein
MHSSAARREVNVNSGGKKIAARNKVNVESGGKKTSGLALPSENAKSAAKRWQCPEKLCQTVAEPLQQTTQPRPSVIRLLCSLLVFL